MLVNAGILVAAVKQQPCPVAFVQLKRIRARATGKLFSVEPKFYVESIGRANMHKNPGSVAVLAPL